MLVLGGMAACLIEWGTQLSHRPDLLRW